LALFLGFFEAAADETIDDRLFVIVFDFEVVDDKVRALFVDVEKSFDGIDSFFENETITQ
jgi:hypothetical protein